LHYLILSFFLAHIQDEKEGDGEEGEENQSTHTPYVGPLLESIITSKGPFFPPLREDPPTLHIVALYH